MKIESWINFRIRTYFLNNVDYQYSNYIWEFKVYAALQK